jgi:hypothetical protein
MPDIRDIPQIGFDNTITDDPSDASIDRVLTAVHIALVLHDDGINDWQIRPVVVAEGKAEPEKIELRLVSLDEAEVLPDEMRERITAWGYEVVEEHPDNSRWSLRSED